MCVCVCADQLEPGDDAGLVEEMLARQFSQLVLHLEAVLAHCAAIHICQERKQHSLASPVHIHTPSYITEEVVPLWCALSRTCQASTVEK